MKIKYDAQFNFDEKLYKLFKHRYFIYLYMSSDTMTRKSIGHVGFFKKIISLVATNLKFELNIVDI